jgi:chloramphenicol 3-O phosphotransferase
MPGKAKIVLLNGAGSAGKSSIAKAIQAQASSIFLHVQMDAFLDMMPQKSLGTPDGLTFEVQTRNGKPFVNVITGPALERTLRGMRHAIAALAGQDCNMVIDDVMLDDSSREYRALLAPYDFHMVGVHAPLAVLEQRERERGDRMPGLAHAQFDAVHRGRIYDLEIDSSTMPADACAAAIVRAFGL